MHVYLFTLNFHCTYTKNPNEIAAIPTIADVKCQGVYYRKYSVLHEDRVAGGTTTKKLWECGRRDNTTYVHHSTAPGNPPKTFTTCCDCCTTYQQWKANHTLEAKSLQILADEPTSYQLLPKEQVVIQENGQQVTYIGTIRALQGSTMGECKGVAKSTGPHPYVCIACNALVHGKTSSLNRKLLRNNTLKHPRSVELRATKSGVNHKFCTANHLESALSSRKQNEKMKTQKLSSLAQANQRLLSDSWHMHESA